MDTAYTRATTDEEREALAHKIARLRVDGVPWNGPGGIVDSMRLVSSATQGRALLRKHRLDAVSGGPVEILPSYDRYEINPATGKRRGDRAPRGLRSHTAGQSTPSPRTPVRLSPPPGPTERTTSATPPGGAKARSRATRASSGADPLIGLAQGIARETGRYVPTPNPDGPTTSAKLLFVLRDPGATPTSGANETGVLDPYLNRDPSAARMRAALGAASIDPNVCVWWNASPYH